MMASLLEFLARNPKLKKLPQVAVFCSLHLDFGVNTSWKREILKALDRLRVGI